MTSCVGKEHETMSDKEFFKQVMPKKSQLQKLKKLLILVTPISIHVESFSGCVSDWSILY